MSLADQIAERNTEQDQNNNIDELGLPVPQPETPEYLVARALLLHTPKDSTPNAGNCLHRRGGQLYLGRIPLDEKKATLYDLTHLRRPLKEWEVAAFWRTLKQYAPVLDRRFLQVADDLYWDIEKAELLDYNEVNTRRKG